MEPLRRFAERLSVYMSAGRHAKSTVPENPLEEKSATRSSGGSAVQFNLPCKKLQGTDIFRRDFSSQERSVNSKK